MSGAPQFPDPLGIREVYRPGATAHKAGMDTARRLDALENGASGRPGPSVVDGSSKVADVAAHGGETWIAPTYHMLDIATGRFVGTTIGTTGFVIRRMGDVVYGGTAGSVLAMFYLDPADMPDGSLDLYVKLDAWAITETNPTDSTLTVTLNEVTGVSAGTITGIGAAVCTATLSPNLANTSYQGESTDAVFPAASFYIVRFEHSVNPAQNMTYGYRVSARVA
jgi:hypothetical protein